MTYRITSDTGEDYGEWCGKNAEGALLAMHRERKIKVAYRRDDWEISQTGIGGRRPNSTSRLLDILISTRYQGLSNRSPA
jgi:hypothetical protein